MRKTKNNSIKKLKKYIFIHNNYDRKLFIIILCITKNLLKIYRDEENIKTLILIVQHNQNFFSFLMVPLKRIKNFKHREKLAQSHKMYQNHNRLLKLHNLSFCDKKKRKEKIK